MKSTVNIVRDLVNNISANVLIESAIDNGNGTYTINSSNTYWLSQYDTITIGGHEYYVNSFVQNVSFTITPTGNGVLPIVTGFSLTPPTYIHGTTKMANNEVDAIKNKMDLVPFIYLYEVLRDRKNTDEASAIERETTLRLFFLNSSSFKDMLTEDVYVNIIDPMQTMVDLFVESVRNSKFFTDNMDYEIIPLIEFSEEGNQNKSVFDCNLSGIELRLSAEIRKDLSCSGYEISPTPSCLPVRITDGLEIINVPSGLTYTCKNVVCEEVNYSILDIDGNVLYSGTKQAGETLTQTIQDSTVNVRKSDNTLIKSVSVLAEGTEDELIADSPITVNGNAFANVKATESLNIPVQYENGTPVGNIVGGVVVIPNPITPLLLNTASTSSASIRIMTKSGGTFEIDWGQGTPTITASGDLASKSYSPNYSGAVIVFNPADINSFNSSSGAWNFDISILPIGMTGTLLFENNAMALTGDIANISQLLTGTLWITGSSMAITGDIANTSQFLTVSFRFVGNAMALTGDIANTSQLLTGTFRIDGNLMTTYGDIAAIASGVRNLYINTPLGEYTYTAGRVWANMTQVFIRPKAGFITSTEADNIFIDIDNSPLAVAGGTIDLRGNCGAVTAASAAARSSLATKGYTCLFNI